MSKGSNRQNMNIQGDDAHVNSHKSSKIFNLARSVNLTKSPAPRDITLNLVKSNQEYM